jgi:hypothetical protein
MEDAGLKPGATQPRLPLLSSRALKREGSAFALGQCVWPDDKREGKGYGEILRLRVATENRKARFSEEGVATLRSE